MRNFLRFFLSVIVFTVAAAQANAQERYTAVQVIPEFTQVKGGQEITLATEITLKPQWHVYWINPGDSGIPVSITWNAPQGVSISEIEWPVPDKISYEVLMNYGYYDRTVLLQKLKLPDVLPEGKIEISGKVSMLVCHEICIPETSDVTLVLNDQATPPQDNSAAIQDAKAKMPQPIKGGFAFGDLEKEIQMSLTLDDIGVLGGAAAEKIEFFPQELGILNHLAKPAVEIDGNRILIRHARGDQPTDKLAELKGLLVVIGAQGQNKGFYVNAARDPALSVRMEVDRTEKKTEKLVQQEISAEDFAGGFVTYFLFAMLGGLILNLMPCVFPILSMKALSLVKMSEKEIGQARQHGLAYTAGVVLSFMAIGGLLVALKSTGAVIGWGFQLQNPLVVAALAYLLFLIGLNLMGFFEVGTRLGNLGDKLTRKSGLSASFFTGMLTTLVATPCTAPFMGVAMGFALLQPAIVSLSIFAAMGIGLAFPYLFLSYVPAARKILPKPGAWMNTFKQFLAFPMFASAIWLVWVVAQQAGAQSILIVLGGMLFFVVGVWLMHFRPKQAKILALVFFVIPVFGLLALLPAPQMDQEFGEAFTQAKLDEALAGKEPVFVEMTAAWCITCKVNHLTSLNIESTKKLFAEKNIRYLIGDWTNYNAQITEYLGRYQRDGVPIYVFYGAPDASTGQRPEPKILPQVLTPAIVQDAVGQ